MEVRNADAEARSDAPDPVTWDVPLSPDGTPTGYLSAAGVEWVARVTFDGDGGRLWPSGVALENTAGRPVTPDMWRRVKVHKVIREARTQVAAAGLFVALVGDDDEREAAGRLAALADDEGQHRGRTYSPEHYVEVGRAYMRALKDSDTQPVQAVRRVFRERYPDLYADLRETTVRGWIRTAKERGHITATARPRRASTREGK